MLERAPLLWSELDFGYHKTDCHIRYTWRDGSWDEGNFYSDETMPVHIAATGLHYGQQSFEGLKAYEQASGDVVIFRIEENARRMARTARTIFMAEVPEQLFIDAVIKVIQANRRFIPPYGTGASLYLRPLLFGSGPQIGVKPAEEYTFLVLVTPVGPYFKTGFKPVHLVVENEFDRAAPNGVGHVKVGGNYAAGMRASIRAKKAGFTEVLFLDAKEKRYIDESGPANFFGITPEGQYVTPDSNAILPSIINMSLVTLAEELGLSPERRPIDVEEIFTFKDAGCCGTAAVITPIGSITYGSRKAVYTQNEEPGEYCSMLYNKLLSIQYGDETDRHGWLTPVPLD